MIGSATSLNWLMLSPLGLSSVKRLDDHQFVAAVVNDLGGNLLALARGEWLADGSGEMLPDRFLIGPLEGALEVVPGAGSGKEGLAHTKDQIIIIGVQEPRRDIVSLPVIVIHRDRMEDIET